METLNLGCGFSGWGTVRVDIARTWSGRKNTANVIADAHNLPFRDKVFDEIRCWHVMEHLSDPHRVLREIVRVSEKADIRFPAELDAKWQFLSQLMNLQLLSFWKSGRRIRAAKEHDLKKYSHLWTIHPESLGVEQSKYYLNKVELIFLLRLGRKSRLFRKIPLPKVVPYEWVITIN